MTSFPPSHWWQVQGEAQAFRADWRFCLKTIWSVLWRQRRKMKRQCLPQTAEWQGVLRPFPATVTAPSWTCSPRGRQSVKVEKPFQSTSRCLFWVKRNENSFLVLEQQLNSGGGEYFITRADRPQWRGRRGAVSQQFCWGQWHCSSAPFDGMLHKA